MKTINALAKEICKREGKKSQARMGDVKEILSIISDIIADDYGLTVHQILFMNGFRRMNAKSLDLAPVVSPSSSEK